MKAKVTINFSGHSVGDVIDVPEMDIQSLIDKGYVVALEKVEQKETEKKEVKHISKRKY